MIGMLRKMLTNSRCHAQTQVRINVDFANCALRRFSELFFRNTDGILQLSAIGIDDLHIFLRYGGRSVQNNREAGQTFLDLFQNIQTKLRIGAGFEFISTMAGSDGNCQRIHSGLVNKFLYLIRIGKHCLFRIHTDRIFDSGKRPQLSLYHYAMSMRIFRHFLGFCNIVLKRMAGIINHDRSKAVIYAVFANVKICAMVQMQYDRNITQLYCRFHQFSQVNRVRIFPRPL